jgi:predicted RecA/RadA family phage recombinase
MRNFIQQGVNITVTAPANVLSGDGVLVGSLFGVAATHAQEGQQVECTTTGVFALPGSGLTQGQKAYWDDTNKVVTGTASGNHLIGHAIADAANGLVRVRLSA